LLKRSGVPGGMVGLGEEPARGGVNVGAGGDPDPGVVVVCLGVGEGFLGPVEVCCAVADGAGE